MSVKCRTTRKIIELQPSKLPKQICDDVERFACLFAYTLQRHDWTDDDTEILGRLVHRMNLAIEPEEVCGKHRLFAVYTLMDQIIEELRIAEAEAL